MEWILRALATRGLGTAIVHQRFDGELVVYTTGEAREDRGYSFFDTAIEVMDRED